MSTRNQEKSVGRMPATDKADRPKLRFGGFEGVWEERKLGNVSVKVGSGSTPRGGESVYQKEGIAFIRSQNVSGNKLNFENITYISDKINNQMKNSEVLSKDILLNITGASIGRSCVVPDDFTKGNVNQHVCIVRLEENNSPYFVQAFLSSFGGQKSILRMQTGSGREGLNFQGVRSIKLFFPKKEEQEKIAGFLGVVDEWIGNLKEQKGKLEDYKRGVMQGIFSGGIGFRDGSGECFCDWEERKLGEVFKVVPTKKYQIKNSEILEKGEIKVIDQGQKDVAGYTNQKDKIYKNKEIIVFGDHTTVLKYIDFDFVVGADGTKLLKAVGDNNLKYLFYNLSFNNVHQEGYKRHFSILKNITLQLPSLAEQDKIADFLCSLDNLIQSKQDEIDKAEQWKRGLMQGLFV